MLFVVWGWGRQERHYVVLEEVHCLQGIVQYLSTLASEFTAILILSYWILVLNTSVLKKKDAVALKVTIISFGKLSKLVITSVCPDWVHTEEG